MVRIIYIALISILLLGCAATFNGFVTNESGHDIFVVPPFEAEFSWVIESGTEEKINWCQECITVNTLGGIKARPDSLHCVSAAT